MKKAAAILVALALLAVPVAQANEHLVSPQAAEQQLLGATAARAQDLATVDAFVSSPQGAAAMATLGVDAARVRGSLSAMSDSELQDVAQRAAALQADPVAGAPFSKNQIIWIALIAAAVIVLIAIIA